MLLTPSGQEVTYVCGDITVQIYVHEYRCVGHTYMYMRQIYVFRIMCGDIRYCDMIFCTVGYDMSSVYVSLDMTFVLSLCAVGHDLVAHEGFAAHQRSQHRRGMYICMLCMCVYDEWLIKKANIEEYECVYCRCMRVYQR